jgi:DNA-binding PadR family transcriptional regulator
VGERTVDDQRILRVVDDLHARGYLELTRCGPDGEDNSYRITDVGRQALLGSTAR